jgi:hypothetical protein
MLRVGAVRYAARMSWDVLFQDLPPGIRAIDEIPSDFRPGPLCTRAELVAAIRVAAPAAVFSGPWFAVLDADGFSIEVSAGDADPVRSVMLHVRGAEGALPVIRALSAALGRTAIDCSAGELMDFESQDVGEGYEAWRAYRDQIVRGPR